jgi:murein tripeptide amidase MpaA
LSYYNVLEAETALLNLAAAFPAQADVVPLPNPTAEGRRSHALHLSTAPEAGRDAVVMIGGVHGDEWGSCEILLNLASDLLQAKALGSGLAYGPFGAKAFDVVDMDRLLEARDLILFPLVNPDGRRFSQDPESGDPQWRKNRNPKSSQGSSDRVGVDINRNFDFVFDLANFALGVGVSASVDSANGQYQGLFPHSEAESANVVWLLDRFEHAGWFIDLHSAGGVFQYAWHHDESQETQPGMNFRSVRANHQMGLSGAANYQEFLAAQDRAEMQRLAAEFANALAAVRGKVYGTGPGFGWGVYPGTSHDYAYSRHLSDSSKGKVLGFTCEWGRLEHRPDWAEMEKIIEDVSAGLIGFLLATLSK